jgi:endonuclease/exonuclease/phosphatase family metal-dependent hydrolase
MLRGWVCADVLIGGRTLRVINTHLEIQRHPEVQRAQCEELLRFLGASPHPVVVLGDLNSDAHGGDTDTYRTLVGAGLRDAWREVRDGPGNTCCHDADLRNEEPSLTKRIDHVLVGEGIEVIDVELVGDDVTSRTTSGLWASDHAGVAASLRLRG